MSIKSQFHTLNELPIKVSIDIADVNQTSIDLWDKFVRYKLSSSGGSTQTINNHINVNIRAFMLIIELLNKHKLSDISRLSLK